MIIIFPNIPNSKHHGVLARPSFRLLIRTFTNNFVDLYTYADQTFSRIPKVILQVQEQDAASVNDGASDGQYFIYSLFEIQRHKITYSIFLIDEFLIAPTTCYINTLSLYFFEFSCLYRV